MSVSSPCRVEDVRESISKLWLIVLTELLGLYSSSNNLRTHAHTERRWNVKVHNSDLIDPCGEEPIESFPQRKDEDESVSGMNLAIFALEREKLLGGKKKKERSSRKCDKKRLYFGFVSEIR